VIGQPWDGRDAELCDESGQDPGGDPLVRLRDLLGEIAWCSRREGARVDEEPPSRSRGPRQIRQHDKFDGQPSGARGMRRIEDSAYPLGMVTRRARHVLTVVATPDANASILAFAPGKGLVGGEPHELACGGCGAVVGDGVSPDTVRNKFAAPAQLLLRCGSCGAHNRLPAQVGN